MAEQLILNAQDKKGMYEEVLPQIQSVIEDETDLIANLANVSAILKEAFSFFWVGFYITRKDNNLSADEVLVLGPFQGPLACTRIRKGEGVCGTSWNKKQTLIVPDVSLFRGHIACSSLSRSEIVVPIIKDNIVTAVLDIDSKELNCFDQTDQYYLELLATYISDCFRNYPL